MPARLVWQPVLDWKRQFHWLWWEQPVHGAIVVADLDRAAGTIAIACDREVRELWVLLDERVVDLDQSVRVTLDGVVTFEGVPRASLAAMLPGWLHPDGKLRFGARVPAWPRDG